MTQEAISELDMDVFAKHIGPYFSWLESKIESGWEQSEHVQKDVLRETRSTSTTMRARFILGVSRTDFVREVERAIELLELAKEAFPQESDELDAKIQQLTSGIAEKLGNDLLPAKYKSKASHEVPKLEAEVPKTKIIIEEPEKIEIPKTKLVLEKKVEAPKVKIVPKTKIIFEKKFEPKKIIEKKLEAKPSVTALKNNLLKKKVKTAKPKLVPKKAVEKSEKKSSLLSRVLRSMIYRGGI